VFPFPKIMSKTPGEVKKCPDGELVRRSEREYIWK